MRTLAQLDVIRWDRLGDGSALDEYRAAFPQALPDMGCSSAGCSGYELVADLDFDTNGNGYVDADDAYWNDGAGSMPLYAGGKFAWAVDPEDACSCHRRH